MELLFDEFVSGVADDTVAVLSIGPFLSDPTTRVTVADCDAPNDPMAQLTVRVDDAYPHVPWVEATLVSVTFELMTSLTATLVAGFGPRLPMTSR